MNKKLVLVIVGVIVVVFCVSLATASIISVSKGEYQATTDNLTAQIVTLQAERDTLVSADQVMRQSLLDLGNAIKLVVSDTNNSLSSLATQFASANNQYNDLSNQVSNLNNRIPAIDNSLSTLSTKMDGKVDLATLQVMQVKLVDAEKLITTLQTQFTSLQAQFTSLSQTVASLQAVYYGNVRLLGNSDANILGVVGGDNFILSRFLCGQSGLLSVIRLKCNASGAVKVALYSDNGTLITANASGVNVIAGLNAIGVTIVQVNSGTYYWLGFNSSASIVGYGDINGTNKYISSSYSGFVFPNILGLGYSLGGANMLISGWVN